MQVGSVWYQLMIAIVKSPDDPHTLLKLIIATGEEDARMAKEKWGNYGESKKLLVICMRHLCRSRKVKKKKTKIKKTVHLIKCQKEKRLKVGACSLPVGQLLRPRFTVWRSKLAVHWIVLIRIFFFFFFTCSASRVPNSAPVAAAWLLWRDPDAVCFHWEKMDAKSNHTRRAGCYFWQLQHVVVAVLLLSEGVLPHPGRHFVSQLSRGSSGRTYNVCSWRTTSSVTGSHIITQDQKNCWKKKKKKMRTGQSIVSPW